MQDFISLPRIAVFVLGCALLASNAVGQTLRILSFNAEHWMSEARFDAWRKFCAPLEWKDPDPNDHPSALRRPESITYCNALDGTDGRGRLVSSPVQDRDAWRAKRALLAKLIADAKPDLVLLQEVSDAAAAQSIVPAGWRTVSTAELWKTRQIAQNLAIAWPDSLAPRVVGTELVEPISQRGEDGRMTRPGLAIELNVGPGRRIAILNVHLKAGCRKGRLDEANSRSATRADKRRQDCAVFQRQLPVMEDWIDAKLRARTAVLIAGDFNRDLLDEIDSRAPKRNDGSRAGDRPDSPAVITGLLAELSDSDPPQAWFSVVRPTDYPRDQTCHRRIDNFILSKDSEALLDVPLRSLRNEVIALPARSADTLGVRASDHCPHLLVLPFK